MTFGGKAANPVSTRPVSPARGSLAAYGVDGHSSDITLPNTWAGRPGARLPDIPPSRYRCMVSSGHSQVGTFRYSASPFGGHVVRRARALAVPRPCSSGLLCQAADFAVAQAVEDQGQQFPRRRHTGDGRATALLYAPERRGDGRPAVVTSDSLDRRQRTRLEPCLVICPRWAMSSDSRWLGVRPAQLHRWRASAHRSCLHQRRRHRGGPSRWSCEALLHDISSTPRAAIPAKCRSFLRPAAQSSWAALHH
jgi:hypothetical protein